VLLAVHSAAFEFLGRRGLASLFPEDYAKPIWPFGGNVPFVRLAIAITNPSTLKGDRHGHLREWATSRLVIRARSRPSTQHNSEQGNALGRMLRGQPDESRRTESYHRPEKKLPFRK
jgi:hypothetical protein